MKYLKKKLIIENVKVDYIAKKYGTPTYCYSYSELKKNINNFKNSFRSFSPLICFAVKSNSNINLITGYTNNKVNYAILVIKIRAKCLVN